MNVTTIPNNSTNNTFTFNFSNSTPPVSHSSTNSSSWIPPMPNFSDWIPSMPNLTDYTPSMPTSEQFSEGFEKVASVSLLNILPIALASLAIVTTLKAVYNDLSKKTIQHGDKSSHGLTSGQKLVSAIFGAIVTTAAAALICERARVFSFSASKA